MPVAIAMSGGMDSTASALMLKEKGYEVVGIHMRLHHHDDTSWQAAQKAAQEVGIYLHRVDLSREFEARVVQTFIQEYARGRTPSPCPICNRFIKMTLLFEHARGIGCETLATGHYARIGGSPQHPLLLRGVDKLKDQSYFLFMVSRDSLSRTTFPVGHRTKLQVRAYLRKQGISMWESGESQELCFVPHGDYRSFLRRHGVDDRPGDIVDSTGNILGKHKGISGYTVGQRRGLGISSRRPLYVVKIDRASRTIVVGTKEETFVSALVATDFNLLVDRPPAVDDRFLVKVRSTASAVPCRIVAWENDSLTLLFETPQSGVAPGQAAVLYSDDIVVGGGWIASQAGAIFQCGVSG